jgi:hypothetical protein
MIKKWERSGQGDGGRHDEEEEQEEQADTDNPTSVQLGKLEGRSQFALDCRQNFLNDGNHGKLSSWYLYFWEQVDKFELLASTVTELATSIGAADANSVPAVVEGSRSVGTNSSRKKKRRRRLSDDSSGSSSASKGVTAKLTSVMEMLGRETKMSRISNHVGSLREEARSISARIDEVNNKIMQFQMMGMETESQQKREMYDSFIANYSEQLSVLRTKLENVDTTVTEQEHMLQS